MNIYNAILIKQKDGQVYELHLLLYEKDLLTAERRIEEVVTSHYVNFGWQLYGVFHVDKHKLEIGGIVTL